MSTVATRAELAQLGLTSFDLADSVEVPWPSTDVSQALGRGQITALSFTAMLAAKFVGVPFAPVRIPAFGSIELSIAQTSARVLRVTARPGQQLHIYALKGSVREGVTVYTPSEDPSTTYIDAEKLPGIVARTEAAGIALSATESGLEFAELVKPIELAPLTRLEPPVMEWARASGDTWLVEQAMTKTQSHSSWSRVVAAGMLARLAVPSSGSDARSWMQRFADGVVDDSLAAPRRWVRTLSRQETLSVEELALAEVEAVHSAIEEFVIDVDNSVPRWTDVWCELCHRRDDLECVLVLLDESGAADRLRHALRGLDREGEIVRLSVPPLTASTDERMRRTALKNPGAWWGAMPSAS